MKKLKVRLGCIHKMYSLYFNVDVHRTHCCKVHGCKYGHLDCPVATGLMEQAYPCEDCPSEIVPLYRLTKLDIISILELYETDKNLTVEEILNTLEIEGDYSEYGS
jgi:hypothetical protein